MSTAQLLYGLLSEVRFFWECATPPHIHPTFMYITARDKFCQPSPPHYCAQRGVYSLIPRSFHPSVFACSNYVYAFYALLSKPALYNRHLLNNSFRLILMQYSLNIIHTSSFIYMYNEQSGTPTALSIALVSTGSRNLVNALISAKVMCVTSLVPPTKYPFPLVTHTHTHPPTHTITRTHARIEHTHTAHTHTQHPPTTHPHTHTHTPTHTHTYTHTHIDTHMHTLS